MKSSLLFLGFATTLKIEAMRHLPACWMHHVMRSPPQKIFRAEGFSAQVKIYLIADTLAGRKKDHSDSKKRNTSNIQCGAASIHPICMSKINDVRQE